MAICGFITIASIFLVMFVVVIVIYRKKIKKKKRVRVIFDFNTVVLSRVHTHT